jgi:hypothetical protein
VLTRWDGCERADQGEKGMKGDKGIGKVGMLNISSCKGSVQLQDFCCDAER